MALEIRPRGKKDPNRPRVECPQCGKDVPLYSNGNKWSHSRVVGYRGGKELYERCSGAPRIK